MPLLLKDGNREVTSNIENQLEGGSQEFHVQGTFDDLGSSNTERFNRINNACTYEFGQASYSGFADCFFNMNEDTITDNDYLHTSANRDDIGEDMMRIKPHPCQRISSKVQLLELELNRFRI